MSRYISATIKEEVFKRASFCCEYCLLSQEDAYFTFQIDHIISLKHGGQTILENLALSCVLCNRNKGSDIGSVLFPERNFIRFYNPRIDSWRDHFELEGALIQPKNFIGKATTKILDFNHIDRVIERQILLDIGNYPRGNY